MIWYYILGGLAAGAAICTAAAVVVRSLRSFFAKLDTFFEDWYGVPGRDGVPERKGVMRRLQDQDDVLHSLKAEVTLNSGKSLKDIVVNIRNEQIDIKARLEQANLEERQSREG